MVILGLIVYYCKIKLHFLQNFKQFIIVSPEKKVQFYKKEIIGNVFEDNKH